MKIDCSPLFGLLRYKKTIHFRKVKSFANPCQVLKNNKKPIQIRLDRNLVKEIKKLCLDEDVSLTDKIKELIEKELKKK